MQPSENKYENYTCGPDTNYEWQPFNWCPECVDEGNLPHIVLKFINTKYREAFCSSYRL